jgi:hypothetical protein
MKYVSKYSNDKTVTPAQYITEIICEHKAKIENLDLHFRFWTTKKWEIFYKNQISTAYKLIKIYDPKAIINALKKPENAKIYSLRAPTLVNSIKKEQLLLESQNTKISQSFDRSEDKKYDNKQNKKSILSKLKDIE